ncbi:GntR family transcriptional regulator [Variovorax paradoxus]|jgi:DNA-binding transcriptional LysR family regulator|uniref:LysR family transcriptional regulator n=1 Tax=Variovorax paradoxus TaxID=34073 RepID=UPI0006E58061|nr:GntR family transcriptional regulator [Variovorax paradoxus]KPV07395.1 GntR family transcriptional regulator [Variovorax paradoxus]KPV07922.1 GntR family transcriptional regulator [Variovorax paradoxus]KPV21864.1 GntR family transcriptional regulator [Variovorax paradoxus]KPV31701.1 GntR family transcriptional regulator [Variovorax paradoxus]
MNLHRLDLVSLSLFNLVVRTGSISKGAELAHLAVGAASKRISDLEAAVGTPLLERHSRGVTLTVAGDALHRHAQRILDDVDQLAADLSDYASGVLGVVRLWVNTSAVTQFLPRGLSGFVAANPGIRIELEERNSSEIVLAVLDGRADAGIFAEGTPSLGLHIVNYRIDRLVMVVPRGHPLARRRSVRLEEATEYDFVSLPAETSLAQRLQAAAEALGRRLRLRIQVRSFDAVCQMVAAGMGVAVLPHAAIQPHLRSMGLREIALDDAWAERRLLIGLRDAGVVPRHVRTLIDHLCQG